MSLDVGQRSSPHTLPLLPFFGWEGSPSKIDFRKTSGTLVLTSLLEDRAGMATGKPVSEDGGGGLRLRDGPPLGEAPGGGHAGGC